ncbi:hypothetical protein H9X78_13380 [Clostridium saudiense]|nr:hypothetical protein [Clostridium saudiense]
MKKKVVLAVGLIGIIFFISSFYFNYYFIQKSITGNDEEGIKNSIFYLHKDYMDGQEEIKIIDEFNYDYNKIVLFRNEELTGIAKFDKDSRGKYKIKFVETLDANNIRKVSKAP